MTGIPDYLSGIGTYNITCGGVNQTTCPAGAPTNEEAEAFLTAYDHWKTTFLMPNGLVKNQEPGKSTEVTSDACANGLFFALMAGDKETFDLILEGMESKLQNKHGLYSWRATTTGSVLEKHSATDADMHAAAAISLAHAKWGTSATKYKDIAQRLINGIWNKEIFHIKHLPDGAPIKHAILASDKKGEVYRDRRFEYRPAYFAPALLRIFAAVDTNPEHKWQEVIDDGYTLLDAIVANADKLKGSEYNPIPSRLVIQTFSDRIHMERHSQTRGNEYDSIRVFLELARDQSPQAQTAASSIVRLFGSVPTSRQVTVGGYNNELAQAYYGLLLLASSQPHAYGINLIDTLRLSYPKHHAGDYIGSSGRDGESYYFQSLLLHATGLLGGFTFGFTSLPKVVLDRAPLFNIRWTDAGEVYVNDTLIVHYTETFEGKTPAQRAEESAGALQRAYADDALRPKYLQKDSGEQRVAMEIHEYRGVDQTTLFEFGPEDLEAAADEEIGFGLFDGLHRWLASKVTDGTSYELLYETYEESWFNDLAQWVGMKARKTALELAWDRTYNGIYLRLIESGIIDLKAEACRQVEDPPTIEAIAETVTDFYTLTEAARLQGEAAYSRAYDDVSSLVRYITLSLQKNPLTGFPRTGTYYETLFSLAGILIDQEGRFDIEDFRDILQLIETQVYCAENLVATKRCELGAGRLVDPPILGLARASSFFEAAEMLYSTILQSDVNNFPFKARALREKADLYFRRLEKGIQVSRRHPMPVPKVRSIVGHYLASLELWRDRTGASKVAGLAGGDWTQSWSYQASFERLDKPENYYGLAAEYTGYAYSADPFELAKLSICMGKFYLFHHRREFQIAERGEFDQVQYDGLKEAETWFKFVTEDPQDYFDDQELNVYKAEALIRLAETQAQLARLEEARGNTSAAGDYLFAAGVASLQAHDMVQIEVNRLPSKEWVDEGASLSLRNVYLTTLTTSAFIDLLAAERKPAGSTARQNLVKSALVHVRELIEQRQIMVMDSIKDKAYTVAHWALSLESTFSIDVDFLLSIMAIDPTLEGSSFVRLQELALALLIYESVKTTGSLADAEAKFRRWLPLPTISPELKKEIGLGTVDLTSLPDAFKQLIICLNTKKKIPQHVRDEFLRVLP
ncbi:MAG: glycosyl hydrolase family 8 [bacterium]